MRRIKEKAPQFIVSKHPPFRSRLLNPGIAGATQHAVLPPLTLAPEILFRSRRNSAFPVEVGKKPHLRIFSIPTDHGCPISDPFWSDVGHPWSNYTERIPRKVSTLSAFVCPTNQKTTFCLSANLDVLIFFHWPPGVGQERLRQPQG